MKQIHPTREAWLEEAMSEVSVQFKRLGFPLPKRIRVTCGFTSGGTRKRPGGKVLIGECWDSSRSGDKSFEIMVSPTEADPIRTDRERSPDSSRQRIGLGCPTDHDRARRHRPADPRDWDLLSWRRSTRWTV